MKKTLIRFFQALTIILTGIYLMMAYFVHSGTRDGLGREIYARLFIMDFPNPFWISMDIFIVALACGLVKWLNGKRRIF